jgi:hypothetical protein
VASHEPVEFQPKPILRKLREHEVDFVLIVGLAGIARGSSPRSEAWAREERSSPTRPEVMPYSTYEDARAREAELLRSAQNLKIGAAPRSERRAVFSPSRILEILRGRHGAMRKPAAGRI